MNAMVGTVPSSTQDTSNFDNDSRIASKIKQLLNSGKHQEARGRFEDIIAIHQNRITRIAYYYLRDPSEVDEVVQDTFFKAFIHLPTFQDNLYFSLWLSRIAVNGCLDRLKAQSRRRRWVVPTNDRIDELVRRTPASAPSIEQTFLANERRDELLAAVEQLPARQRSIVILNQFEEYSTKDVSNMLNIAESTVRVHLFRAIRSLRTLIRNVQPSSKDNAAV